jgi:hypothetical protein
MYLTAIDAAEALYQAVPHDLSGSILADYGIEATPEQASQITREVLCLNLFWIDCALRTALTIKQREQVWAELRTRIVRGWASDLGLDEFDATQYFQEVEERWKVYGQIMEEGASPMMFGTETAAILASLSAIQPEDRNKVVALLVDYVPVDHLGELAEEIKLP